MSNIDDSTKSIQANYLKFKIFFKILHEFVHFGAGT